jgi:hypothetical protein
MPASSSSTTRVAQLSDQRGLGDEHAMEQHHFFASRRAASITLTATSRWLNSSRAVHDACCARSELAKQPVLAYRVASRSSRELPSSPWNSTLRSAAKVAGRSCRQWDSSSGR